MTKTTSPLNPDMSYQSELFGAGKIILRLNPAQAYSRKQRVWQLFLAWQKRVIRAFYPATGGSGHLMHNWHLCSNDANDAKLAEWINSTTWARYNRLIAKLDARNVEREHIHHVGKFIPLWCPICTFTESGRRPPRLKQLYSVK